MEKCAVCGIAAVQKCSACSLKFYCSRDHQKVDWKNHKNECKCYEVLSNEVLGRYMVAKRDIKPGEIILHESPCVFGPKITSQPMCLGCLKTIIPLHAKDFYKCSKCNWPMCGENCENSLTHVDECRVMQEKKFISSIKNTGKPKTEVAYCVIVPLRVILLKKSNPKVYKNLMELVSHLDQRINTKLYQAFRINLVPFLRDFLKFSEYSEMEILNIAGILDTNCFEIILPSNKIRARGIYPMTAMMSHECIPNTKHFVDENLEMKVIACSLIKKGEMILTSYTHPLKTTVERRYQLKEAKCFDCLCPRCKDPTEMKTFASGLKCVECQSGIVVSTDPLNNLAEWKCLECIGIISAKQALTTLNIARVKLETINKRSVEECEKYLKEFETILAPSSVFMTDVKYVLSLLYGNVPGFMMEEMTSDFLERKLLLCEELEKTLEFFEPGISNSTMNVKFELSAARIARFKQQIKSKIIGQDEGKTLIFDEVQKAQEAYKILVAGSEGKNVLECRMKRLVEQSII